MPPSPPNKKTEPRPVFWLLVMTAGSTWLAVLMRFAYQINGETGLGVILTCYVLAAVLFTVKDPPR